ncbi:ABC transporter permease [Fictibacillus sp. 7GRE50]|uniref:oligopeptide ABC transporter permease n=1 Tax=unclassified Fictibacillus TaxID=2644029 RepID=UPI0018CDC7DF|nr:MULTISPECIES: oligopeptide ABC transporter permease [unclassified Fictibacillus]MBH0166124.1 ABC transporter permease [Fictibacillus sp. 7GRE50]MBH0170546.1 ABC transporter permease [Fictibacillus sp. 18YEL24]MBH0172827.1 ABC transporter permease [Fictibacillus sp. 23RED33]
MSMSERKLTPDLFRPANLDSNKAEEILKPSLSFWQDAFRRLKKNKGAMLGLFAIVFIIIFSFVAPVLSKYGIDDQELMRSNLPPKIPGLEKIEFLGLNGVDIRDVNQYEMKNVPKGDYFWFGTDSLGRDQWTRVWKGTQISLYIAFLAAAIDLIVGVTYGGVSAFYGGRTDDIMQRIVEILIGIPQLVVVILFIIILDPGILSITLALVITGWIGMSRIVRAQVISLKNREFVLASKTLGSANGRLISKHLLPNTLGAIIVASTFTIPGAIFSEAFLSFIGLGIQPPTASLGSLISDGFKSIRIYPHLAIFPASVMCILMISFNLLGDGLRDALDPKMRK